MISDFLVRECSTYMFVYTVFYVEHQGTLKNIHFERSPPGGECYRRVIYRSSSPEGVPVERELQGGGAEKGRGGK